MTATSVSSIVHKSAAVVGVSGLFLLAGCSGATETGAGIGSEIAEGMQTPSESDSGGYTDGTYTAEGSYQTPETVEEISVTLTLEAGAVTDVEVTGDPQARETEQYQGQFIDGIAEEVVGVSIDELNVSRVAGSSLTSGGFNAAVEEIKDQAAA